MSDNPEFAAALQEIAAKVTEPMGLDRWTLHLKAEPNENARASCDASDEYREAYVIFDLDKLLTGDDLSELVVHELTHCHTSPLHDLAWQLAKALSESVPENMKAAVWTLLEKQVDKAAERVTTDIGHVFLKLLRRAQVLDTPLTQQEIDALPF